jgi:hypothetical protein
MLLATSLNVPRGPQFPPVALFATMVLDRSKTPELSSLYRAPPEAALLSVIVQLMRDCPVVVVLHGAAVGARYCPRRWCWR